jgi:hypothetical protein
LKRFLIVSPRQVPHSRFDGVRTPPEELVNSASPKLALRLLRSRINQPDPTFPQSPGIIHGTLSFNLTLHRRSVLSMNCEHSSRFSQTAHQLISTGYPPKSAGEERVDNFEKPIKSRLVTGLGGELFTSNARADGHCEQVVSAGC